MRALVLLLVLLNIGFAAWQLALQDQDIKQLSPADSGTEPLRLLTEGKVSQAPQVAPSPDEPNTPSVAAPERAVPLSPTLPPVPICFVVGPIADPEQASLIAQRLRAAGITSIQRVELSGDNPSYRVVLPSLPSRESALQVGRQLAADGVTDYQVIVDDSQRNVVTLGVFKDQPAAARRQAQIAALGYAPRIEARESPAQSYWLDTRQESQFSAANSAWSSLQAEYPEIGRRTKACP